MPNIWGLHNYSETNRFEDNGTKAILADIPGQLWLTETGGLAEFKPSFPYSLSRQARATGYMFSLAEFEFADQAPLRLQLLRRRCAERRLRCPDMTTEIAPLDGAYAAEPDAGLGTLATSRGNLPLDAVDVRAAIAGTSARVELTQDFRNPFDVPLEATYIFPLPDRAAVTAMRMECAGHVVEGVLRERSQAREEYDQAIAEGRRAAIAEEDRPDVFTMRVGNIAPGERVTVRLVLAQRLPYCDGEVTFRFPLVVAPRYIPGHPLPGAPAGSGIAADTGAVPDASRISPPVLLPGFPNPVRLTLSADIDPAGLPLSGIRSSLHATAEQRPGGHTIVALHPGERLDRDFILRLAVASQDQLATSLMLTPDPEADSDEGTFTLTLVPPDGDGRPRPRDVVLVLDRSGSMSGWKMVAARRAAARITDTLTEADRFAVLCFDNVVERPPDLPDGLAGATDRNRFRAVEWLARTDARGGTEMLAPLEEAVRLLSGDGSGPGPGAGPGHRRAGRQRGPDPGADRNAAGRDAGARGGHRPGRQRRVPVPARRGRARPLRAGGVRGPARRGGRAHPPPDRRAAGHRARAGRGRRGHRARDGGAGAAAGPVPWRGGHRERTLARGARRSDHGDGHGSGRHAVRDQGQRGHRRQPGQHGGLGPRSRAGPGGPVRQRGRSRHGQAGPAGTADHRRLVALRRAVPVHGVRGRRLPGRHGRDGTAPGNPAGRTARRMGSGGCEPAARDRVGGRGRGRAAGARDAYVRAVRTRPRVGQAGQ